MGSRSSREEYAFVCPECGESLTVSGSVRDALVANGCVVCGTTVTRAAFTVGDGSGEEP